MESIDFVEDKNTSQILGECRQCAINLLAKIGAVGGLDRIVDLGGWKARQSLFAAVEELRGAAPELIDAMVPRGAQEPGARIGPSDGVEMFPEAEQDFLSGVLGVGGVAEDRPGEAIDVVLVAPAVPFEFQLA